MTVRKAVSVLLPLVMMAGASSAAFAQSTEPDPSLKDFRLDPVPSQPRQTGPQTSESTSPTTSTQTPQPRQQQPVAPPPVQPTVTQPTGPRPGAVTRSTATQPAERGTTRTPPSQQAPTTNADKLPGDTGAPTATDTPSAEPTATDALPATDAATTGDTAAATAADNAPSTASPGWAIWAALAALLAMAAAWLWRRQAQRTANDSADAATVPIAPEPQPAEPAIEEVTPPLASAVEPVATAARSPQPVVAAPPAAGPVPRSVPPQALKGTITARAPTLPYASDARAQLVVEYLPARADVGVDNLTVAGRMRVTNIGNAPARAMQLRLALTSASAQQAQVISSFHADTEHFAAKDIGDLEPGKSLDMDVELGIALKDLQSFTINGQRLFVPMLLANVGYAWDARDGQDKAEFACLIGRESTPPQEKMGPLRLDLGPRSFAGLGQRALAA